MERWAAQKYGKGGYRWLEWITDLDSSGSSIHRPELERASRLAIETQADLVVYNFSRYSRNLPEGLAALKTLEDQGIRVHSATEGIDESSAEGELTLQLFMMLNQYQLAKTADSWRGIVRRNKEAGRWHGVPPYGYRRATDEEKKKLGRSSGVIVPDEEHSKNVKKIFTMYGQGKSLYEIGAYADQQQWFSRKGNVKDILRNPAYLGLLPVKKYKPAINEKTKERRRDNHQRPLVVVDHDAPVETVAGAHKAIITEALWKRVQLRLDGERRAPRTKFVGVRHFASGRARCGCGRMLSYNDKKEFGRYLVCQRPGCTVRPGSVNVTELETLVGAVVENIPLTVKAESKRLAQEKNSDLAANRAREKKLRAELAKNEARIEDLIVGIATGEGLNGLSLEETRRAFDIVKRKTQELEAELKKTDDLVVMEPQLGNIKEMLLTVGQMWKLATTSQRADILAALGIVIVIGKARKHRDELKGRVTLKTSLPLIELQGALRLALESMNAGPQRRPRTSPSPSVGKRSA